MGLIDEDGRLSTLGSRYDDDGGTSTKGASTSSMMMVFKDVSGRLAMLVPKCKGGSSTKLVSKLTTFGCHGDDKGPGIKNLQILGDAKPGSILTGCGYSIRGTSTCYFQWVRLEDGIKHYIEGATNPEYVLTADDVDKVIALECIPLDKNDRQGALVRCFANDQKKISCGPDMQTEIDLYVSKGQADFNVLLLASDDSRKGKGHL